MTQASEEFIDAVKSRVAGHEVTSIEAPIGGGVRLYLETPGTWVEFCAMTHQGEPVLGIRYPEHTVGSRHEGEG